MKISMPITIIAVIVLAVCIIPRSCGATRLKWEWHNTPFPKPNFEILIKVDSIKKVFDIMGKIFWTSTTEYSEVRAKVIKGDKKIYGNAISISIPTGITDDFKQGDYAALGMKSKKIAVNIRKIPPPKKE